MQISSLPATEPNPNAYMYAGGVAIVASVLNAPTNTAKVSEQLQAYRELSSQWRDAPQNQRAGLAQALTESPFAQKVQATLNAFTRAAWAGPNAMPPEPQAQILKAFDNLSETDREIVAGMQVDSAGSPAFASGDDYRAKLQADLDEARPNAPIRDTVTLSNEAQTRMAAAEAPAVTPAPAPPFEASPRAQLAAGMAAYSKAAG